MQPSFADSALSRDISRIAAAEAASKIPHGHTDKATLRKLDSAATTASLDSLGFSSIAGVKATASELLDGPAPDAAVTSAPAIAGHAGVPPSAVPAALAYAAPTAEPAAAAATAQATHRSGKAALDAMPSDQQVDLFADPNPGPQVAAAVPMKTPPLHPKIYDASEGTALDPLKEKSYDLNSGKTIPTDFAH